MHQPLISIIIVTHNSRRWLSRQTESLAQQTERRFEVIVLDNASRADERPRAEDWATGVTLIQSETNWGFAEGNNQAAAKAQGALLAFLNPDAFPEPTWLSEMVAAAASYPEAAAFGCTQWRADAQGVLDGTGDVMHVSGLAYRSGYGQRYAPPPTGAVFAACGAAMVVRRDAFWAVGGFDARYFCYFEDVDLCFRLRLKGWDVIQLAGAAVLHVGGGSAGARSEFGDYHGARNRLWTFAKCMPGALFWPLLPLHLGASFFLGALHWAQGRGRASLRGLGAGLKGLGPIWASRKTEQRARTASLPAIMRALLWSPLPMLSRRPKLCPPTRSKAQVKRSVSGIGI